MVHYWQWQYVQNQDCSLLAVFLAKYLGREAKFVLYLVVGLSASLITPTVMPFVILCTWLFVLGTSVLETSCLGLPPSGDTSWWHLMKIFMPAWLIQVNSKARGGTLIFCLFVWQCCAFTFSYGYLCLWLLWWNLTQDIWSHYNLSFFPVDLAGLDQTQGSCFYSFLLHPST